MSVSVFRTALLSTLALLLPALLLAGCGGGGSGGGGGDAVAGGGTAPGIALTSVDTTTPASSAMSAPLFVTREVESNDTPDGANALAMGGTAYGDLSGADDEDWWQVELVAGETYRLRKRAHSVDQATWDSAANPPELRMSIWTADPAPEFVRESAVFGGIDTDILFFEVPDSGPYFLRFESDTTFGGRYAITLEQLAMGEIQRELPEGAPGTMDIGSENVQPAVPGTIRGTIVTENYDLYLFTVAARSVMTIEGSGLRNGTSESGQNHGLSVSVLNADALTGGNDDAIFEGPSGNQFQLDAQVQHVLDPGDYLLAPTRSDGVEDAYYVSWSLDPLPSPGADTNDAPESARPFGLGESLVGGFPPSEERWFSFAGQRGDVVRFVNVDAPETGGAGLVRLSVFDATGSTEIPSSLAGFLTRGTVTTAFLPEDGTYTLRVDRLEVEPGEPDYVHHIETSRMYRGAWEIEPNDAAPNANPYGPLRYRTGNLNAATDRDRYSFSGRADQLIEFGLHGGRGFFTTGRPFSGFGQEFNGVLRILDANNQVIDEANSVMEPRMIGHLTMSAQVNVACVLPEDGEYQVEVLRDEEDDGDTEVGGYVLERRH